MAIIDAIVGKSPTGGVDFDDKPITADGVQTIFPAVPAAFDINRVFLDDVLTTNYTGQGTTQITISPAPADGVSVYLTT